MISQKIKEQHLKSSQNTVFNIAREFSHLLELTTKKQESGNKVDMKPKKLADYIRQRSQSRKQHSLRNSNPQAMVQQEKNQKIKKKKSQLNEIIEEIIKFMKDLKSSIMNNSDLALLQIQEIKIKQISESIKLINQSDLQKYLQNQKAEANIPTLSSNLILKNKFSDQYVSPKFQTPEDKKQKPLRPSKFENQYFNMQKQNCTKNPQKVQKLKYDIKGKMNNKIPEMQLLQNSTGLSQSNYVSRSPDVKIQSPNIKKQFISEKNIKKQKLQLINQQLKQQKQLLQKVQQRRRNISIEIKQSNLKKFKQSK